MRSWLAGSAWYRADPTGFELTSAAAAVFTVGVAVVAVFARFDALVATLGHEDARCSGGITFVAGVLNRAGGIAAVVVESVTVVANLARANAAVATNDLSLAGPLAGTFPIGLYLANAIAPVARQRVPVVTLLDAILIVLSVAAALWYLGFAADGVRAVAPTRRAPAAATGPGGRVQIDATACASTGSAGSAGSGAARGATTSWSPSRGYSLLNRCWAAANSCERENRGEAEPCELACG
jgi:hypothetical protein